MYTCICIHVCIVYSSSTDAVAAGVTYTALCLRMLICWCVDMFVCNNEMTDCFPSEFSLSRMAFLFGLGHCGIL